MHGTVLVLVPANAPDLDAIFHQIVMPSSEWDEDGPNGEWRTKHGFWDSITPIWNAFGTDPTPDPRKRNGQQSLRYWRSYSPGKVENNNVPVSHLEERHKRFPLITPDGTWWEHQYGAGPLEDLTWRETMDELLRRHQDCLAILCDYHC